jgi:transposase
MIIDKLTGTMHYIEPIDRDQLSLASSMNDWVSKDNVVRLIDALVDRIVKAQPDSFATRGQQDLGRKAYRPETLQKLYLYGYLNGICSSRRLERECYRNLEVMWLLGQLRPDHKTISDYRKDNKDAIRTVCLAFRGFLKEQGFIEGHTVAYDGTKIKANASKELVSKDGIEKRMKKLETELEKYLNQLQSNDIAEDLEEQINNLSADYQIEPALLQKIADLQKQLEVLRSQKEFLKTKGIKRYSPADPDARLMKSRDGYIPGYNVQTGVDKKNKLIVVAEVTNSVNDCKQLEPNVKRTVEQTGIVPKVVVADKGYANLHQIQSVEQKYESNETQCVVPLQQSGQEQKDKAAGISFTYDTENDQVICSEGRALPCKARNIKKRGEICDLYRGNCAGCPKKPMCTRSPIGRTVYLNQNHVWIDEYKNRMGDPTFKKGVKERKTLVEHPFGTIKCMLGKIPLRLRGMSKSQIEIDLVTTAYNLKRLLALESMENLLNRVKLSTLIG